MKRSALRRAGGFTLAELLVAATLLSLVMSGVYVLFGSTVRLWRSAEAEFNTYQQARTAMSGVRREYGNLVWQAGYLFEGRGNQFSMIVVSEPMDVSKSEGRHMMLVRYHWNRSGRTLVREERLVELSLPKWPRDGSFDEGRLRLSPRQRFVVAENVTNFEVRYYWTPLPEQRYHLHPPEWAQHYIVDRHERGWGLPQGIELALTITDPGRGGESVTVHQRLVTQTRSAMRRGEHLRTMLRGLI